MSDGQVKNLYLNGHVLFYYPPLNRVFAFGGADTIKVAGETWCLDKEGWQQWTTKGPPARTFAVGIYNPDSKAYILFGGNRVLFGTDADSTFLDDTWMFIDGNWKLIPSKKSPPPRAEALIAYDPVKKEVVLHGGYNRRDKEIIRLKDTWVFKDDQWKELIAASFPNNSGILYFDDQIKKIRMIAGRASTRGNLTSAYLDDKWIADSTLGLKIYNPAYSVSTKNELFVFGGYNGKDRLDSTWKIYNNKRSPLPCVPACPRKRNHAAMTYHEQDKTYILFGGHDGENIYNDVWIFKNDRWEQIIPLIPLKRILNNH